MNVFPAKSAEGYDIWLADFVHPDGSITQLVSNMASNILSKSWVTRRATDTARQLNLIPKFPL